MTKGPPRKRSDFNNLTKAETQLLEEYGTGEEVFIGDGTLPKNPADPDRQISADLIRYLLLGGCKELDPPVHEKGVQVVGAVITGRLDLEGCRCKRDLVLADCHFQTAPNALGANLASLILNDSTLPGLEGDGLVTSGDVFLRGATVTGAVRLLGAQIGGDLDCDGANMSGTADATGPDAAALNADRLVTSGAVFLRGAIVTGEVRLLGAQIGGNLDCDGVQVTAREKGTDGQGADLNLAGAQIKGAFFLRDEARINGTLDLTAASIGSINDDPFCWPTPGNLRLDRCTYGAFTGQNFTAAARIDWLGLQDRTIHGREFQPQPWEHCAKVLREMGHRSDARLILIDKEKRQRDWALNKLRTQINTPPADGRRRFGATTSLRLRYEAQRDWDAVLSAVIGYGYAPQRALYWLLGVWLLGVYIFATAFAQGAMKPNNPFILRSPEWAFCAPAYVPLTANELHQSRVEAPQGQLACFLQQPEAQAYPRFNAWTYSLDTLLPIVSLEMQQYWIPDETAPHQIGQGARIFLWLQIAFGWALSLLAVAGFSGLVRND